MAEVLSPGEANERRDPGGLGVTPSLTEAKLNLYSRHGVRQYWIVDWQQRQLSAYRRVGTALALVATFIEEDTLESPLLPAFRLPIADLFADLPSGSPQR